MCEIAGYYGKELKDFSNYCKKENIKIITWLNSKNLNLIKKNFRKNKN
jgi:hypothetical protein